MMYIKAGQEFIKGLTQSLVTDIISIVEMIEPIKTQKNMMHILSGELHVQNMKML